MKLPRSAGFLSVLFWQLAIASHAQMPARMDPPTPLEVYYASYGSRLAELEGQLSQLQAELISMSKPEMEFHESAKQLCDRPRWTFGADWLAWRPRRRGLDFALLDPINVEGPIGTVQNVEFDYESGVRGRLGYATGNGWELAAAYTYFHAGPAFASATAPPPPGVLKKTTGFASLVGGEVAETASAWASLELQMVDVELGLWLIDNPSVAVQAFGGVRLANLEQNFTASYNGFQYANGLVQRSEDLEGYGLRGGGQAQLRLWGDWKVFGSGAASVLAGFFDTQLTDTDNNGELVIGNVSDSYTAAVVVLEAAAGVSWQRGPLEIGGGYELAAWLNAADSPRFPDNAFESYYVPLSSDLLLDGFFVRMTWSR